MPVVLLPGCPPWEYTDVPQYQGVLTDEHAALLRDLRRGSIRLAIEGRDTRAVHSRLFHTLVPGDHPYYAGHYRGEDFPCLKDYAVHVPADPMVGAAPNEVAGEMLRFAGALAAASASLDAAFALPTAQVNEETKLYFAVAAAASAFQEFLTIHPYANGNGHISRFIVWLLLGRYGYWPTTWTIEPRPTALGYGSALSLHRRRTVDPLERLILEAVVGTN